MLVACGREAEPPPTVTPTFVPFHPTLEPNDTITAMAKTDDGATWYSKDEFDGLGGSSIYSQNQGLFRSKNGYTIHFEVPGTIRDIEVGPDSAVYVAAGCGVLRFQNEIQETLADVTCQAGSFEGPLVPFELAFTADGALWVAGIHSLARYDGRAWRQYDIKARRVLVAPDGSLWADGWDGRAGGDCCFTHLTGDTWITYTHSAELPVSPRLLIEIQALRR